MLPKLRIVLTLTAMLTLVALAIGLLSASRTRSMFAIGTRSAQGSPIERSLPEPPDWRQFVAHAAQRRSQELDRLLDLPAPAEDVATIQGTSAPDDGPATTSADATGSTAGSAVAGLADRAAPAVPPEAESDSDITGTIPPGAPAPATEPEITLSLPELPEIPDAASSIQQALASETAAPPANNDASDTDDRVGTISAAEGAAPAEPAASATLPTRVRLPPVKPPRTAAPKKPRVARKPAPRPPAALNPAQPDPFAGLFGASADTPPTGAVNQRPKAIKRPARRPAGQ